MPRVNKTRRVKAWRTKLATSSPVSSARNPPSRSRARVGDRQPCMFALGAPVEISNFTHFMKPNCLIHGQCNVHVLHACLRALIMSLQYCELKLKFEFSCKRSIVVAKKDFKFCRFYLFA